jgi:hypothetical protein
MKRISATLGRSRLLTLAGVLACLAIPIRASIFIVAICKDGVVAVADSRFTFADSDTGRALAYADGLEKIIHLPSALLAETGQEFISGLRFDRFLAAFSDASGALAAEQVLPSLLEFGNRRLSAEDFQVLERQHLAVAKFRGGQAVICGYDGRLRPCVDRGYVQSSPTDFEALTNQLPVMTALAAAQSARASMQRYIAANGKSAIMGGEFSAALLTPAGIRDLWRLDHPITARTLDELISLVAGHRIPVTLIPPATEGDLDELLRGQ